MDEEQSNLVDAGVVVSVVVITYNHASYIGETLDSILAQKTNFPIEICIGEDESSDGTREICLDYARRYPKQIRLFLRSRKDVMYFRGRPCGRNNFVKTLASCRGKYVALLEGDDYWTDPLKLQKQFDALEANLGAVCCHHWQDVLHEGDVAVGKNDFFRDGYYSEALSTVGDIFANRMRVKTRTAMYRNLDVLSHLPEWIYQVFAGDVPLSMILGKFGDFIFIDEPMAVYRITGNGYSRTGKRFSVKENMERNLLWIDIWDHGLKYHNYRYLQEARATVAEFYRKIICSNGFFDLRGLTLLMMHRLRAPTCRASYDLWLLLYLPLFAVKNRSMRVVRFMMRRVSQRG